MLRVVKVGGSLLAWPLAKDRLKRWCETQTEAKTILIAGGGKLVDQVRRWDGDFGLGPEACHRMAMQCMSITSRLLSRWFSEAVLFDQIDGISKFDGPLIIFDTQDWVLEISDLPATWDLTSDSIAAAVASRLDAFELVLLKSGLPADSDLHYVDPLFSRMVTNDRVRLVDLRSDKFEEVAYTDAIADNSS